MPCFECNGSGSITFNGYEDEPCQFCWEKRQPAIDELEVFIKRKVNEAKLDVLDSVYAFFDDYQKDDIDKIIDNIESNGGDNNG